MIMTARIEQTGEYRMRMKYISRDDAFIEKDCLSLAAVRNTREFPYGWLTESGMPPYPHLDVLVVTDRKYRLGDTERVRIIGVFLRNDGDHKLVSVPAEREETELSALSAKERAELESLYPVLPGEGWFGRERAEAAVRDFMETKKPKTVILVQHPEAEHHLSGLIGANTDFSLTERGKRQAFAIGRGLLREEGKDFTLYVSDMKRALQAAEEIDRSLGLTPVALPCLRSVDAGEGNGKSQAWHDQYRHPAPEGFDPDWRPFDGAESDRELWYRIHGFYQRILHGDEERILVVSHGITVSFLQSMLMGYTLWELPRFRFDHPAGGVSKYTVSPENKVTAWYINRHFPEE